MLIGCPKEIKNNEKRVGLTPLMVKSLSYEKNKILIEENAGIGSGFFDEDYKEAGAKIVKSKEIYENAELIIKVKEPQKSERDNLNPNQIIFTFLHLAADQKQTLDLLNRKVTAIAYETITDNNCGLPLLRPMSEIAGKLAPQMGAWALQKTNGGKGKLLSGIPGVSPSNVLIIGGGISGTQAALIASGMGANVTIMDNSIERLQYLDQLYFKYFKTIFSSQASIEKALLNSDLIIGAVLQPGSKAPMLLSKSQLSIMEKGSVLLDISIDQGGCFETSRVTTHDNPIFEEEGIIHYCVSNMPGVVPNTSTIALSNATFPFILELTRKGLKKACLENNHLMNGLNVFDGNITNEALSKDLNYDYVNPKKLLKKTQHF